MTSVKRQQGVALLFVLLIFAVITTVVAYMVTMTQQNTERQANYLHLQQAKHYAMGGEQYIAMLLERSGEEKETDHWFSPWAEDHQFDVEGGKITIQVIDEQALFNLNVLNGKDSENQTEIFKRLLAGLQIDEQLVERIRGWMEVEPEKLMEQDSIYMSLDPPYRAGGTLFNHVSELRLLAMLDKPSYKKLRPFVTALPEDIGINFNTVQKDLMQAVFPDLSDSELIEIIAARGKTGFADLAAMRKDPVMDGKQINWKNVHGTFSSQYFSAYIKAEFGKVIYYLHSLLAKDKKGKVVVISREEGDYPQWVPELRQSARNK